MSMPRDLVLVRHGQSEANIVQKQRKADPSVPVPPGFVERHDSRMRLSQLGINQAAKTGEWLRRGFPEGFDRYYVSSLVRTAETAGHLALNGSWDVDDRWRERDWGEYNALTDELRSTVFAHSLYAKEQSKWYWCPPGGESLATGVRMRFEDILDTLHRELAGKRVIAVTHGETMEVARFVLERLLPSEWETQERGNDHKIANCQILHYSRSNPESGELSDHIEWRRAVCAWDGSRSWHEGQWVHLGPRRRFSDEALLEMVNVYPTLFDADKAES